MINMSIELIGLDNIPLVEPNDDVCQIIKDAIEKQGCLLKHGDIILIAETLISKAEGNVIKLGDIIPSEESIIIAKQSKKDSKLVEAIINESREVVAVGPDLSLLKLNRVLFVQIQVLTNPMLMKDWLLLCLKMLTGLQNK